MEDIRLTRGPHDEDEAALRDELNDYNIRTTGYTEWEDLGAFIRDDDGELVAGVSALVWGGNCELQLLWVSEGRRGGGLGSKLLHLAEAEARHLGCGKLFLTTYDFQARPFYEKFGFRVIGEVTDHPKGHSYFMLEKALDEGTADG